MVAVVGASVCLTGFPHVAVLTDGTQKGLPSTQTSFKPHDCNVLAKLPKLSH